MTLIFTASALIISLITLWFSHLKGPDIELCNQPETELEDWAETDLNNYLQNKHIPNYLNIKPVQLVFVNNGSKTGAITNIETKFEPNEKFKPFVRSEFFYTEKELPLSVDEGGTGIIRLSSRLEVIDWNRDFRREEITNISDLKQALEKSIELNRKHLTELIEFLKSQQSLGKLRIEMTYLGRQWLKTRTKTRQIAQIAISNNCKLALTGFDILLQKWDTTSAVDGFLQTITRSLDELILILKNIVDNLNTGALSGLDDLSNYWREMNGSSYVIVRTVFEREKSMKEELDSLSQRIKSYNVRVSLVGALWVDADPEQKAELNREIEELRPMIEKALSDVKELKASLIEEIKPSTHMALA